MLPLLLALLLAQVPVGNSSPPGVVVQDEGVDQGRARKLNCVGAGLACTVSAGVGTLTASGGGGSFAVTEVAVDLGIRPRYGFTATVTDGAVTAASKIPTWQSGAAPGAGTITFVNAFGPLDCVSGPCTVSASPALGNVALVAACMVDVNISPVCARVAAVSDTGGNQYVRLGSSTNLQPAQSCSVAELWAAPVVQPTTGVSVSIPILGTFTDIVGVAEYSGMAAVGGSVPGGGNGTSSSVSLITQEANNFAVATFCGDNTGTTTVVTGNMRQTSFEYAVTDNTSGSPSSVTNAVSFTVPSASASVVAEVRATAKTADESEVDPLTCAATPAAGSFTLRCSSPGLLMGRYKIFYSAG